MKRIPWVVLAWAGSLAFAPIVWWLVGDMSQANGVNRTFRAPAWMIENAHLFGVAGIAAIASIFSIEIVGLRFHFFAKHLLYVFLPLIGAAALAAFNYRVMTALTEGSNIGAGVAVLLGMPVAGGLAVIHLYLLRDELKRERFAHLR